MNGFSCQRLPGFVSTLPLEGNRLPLEGNRQAGFISAFDPPTLVLEPAFFGILPKPHDFFQDKGNLHLGSTRSPFPSPSLLAPPSSGS